jgi:hypothetical protein
MRGREFLRNVVAAEVTRLSLCPPSDLSLQFELLTSAATFQTDTQAQKIKSETEKRSHFAG